MEDTEDNVMELEDNEFILQTAMDLRSFVVTEVEKISKKIKTGDERQRQLEHRVLCMELVTQQLQAENANLRQIIETPAPDKHRNCLETVQRAFSSALAQVIDIQTTEDVCEETSKAATLPEFIAKPVPGNPPLKQRRSLKRKVPPETMTKLYTTLDELQPSFKEAIEPFYKEDNRAKCDLLNNVQRAFVKYRAYTILENKELITSVMIAQIVSEGTKMYIWHKDMLLGDGAQDLETYLLTRLRNEKKGLARRRFAQETRQLSEGSRDGEIEDD